ncbi:hypothetical protein VTK73DRAFT_6762 [Phialemonium thermophilum]|uniref:Uncharacterized protein n=1 Tax=Phialemonium thermophilum TaxID=223376 RepID=A0ABR3WHR2_9PEZI
MTAEWVMDTGMFMLPQVWAPVPAKSNTAVPASPSMVMATWTGVPSSNQSTARRVAPAVWTWRRRKRSRMASSALAWMARMYRCTTGSVNSWQRRCSRVMPRWLAEILAFKSEMLSLRRRVALQPGRSATRRNRSRTSSSRKTPPLTIFMDLTIMPSCHSSLESGTMLVMPMPPMSVWWPREAT